MGSVLATPAHAGTRPRGADASPNSDVGPGTQLSLSGYTEMAVDDANQHVFVTGNPAKDSSIVVLDFSGHVVTTITNEPGAGFMLVDPSTSTLFVALNTADAISEIDLHTLTETGRIALGTKAGCPEGMAMAGGKLWVAYTCGGSPPIFGGLASVTLSSSKVRTYTSTTPTLLASDPADVNTLMSANTDGGNLWEYDVSTTPPTVTLNVGSAGGSENLQDLAPTPDGQDLLTAAGYPYQIYAFRLTDYSIDTLYLTGAYPDSVDVTSDGKFIAAGVFEATFSDKDDVQIFSAADGSQVNGYTFTSDVSAPWVAARGVAFTADASRLFAVTTNNSLPSPSVDFHVIADPTLSPSSLTMSALPSLVPPGGTTQLSGTLTLADAASASGKTIHILETPPGGSQVDIGHVKTDSGGNYAFTTPGSGPSAATRSKRHGRAIRRIRVPRPRHRSPSRRSVRRSRCPPRRPPLRRVPPSRSPAP